MRHHKDGCDITQPSVPKAEPTFHFRQPALSAELIIASNSVAALGMA
jgi:hypothetical protein